MQRLPIYLSNISRHELSFCLWANRACGIRSLQRLLAGVSWLGNGVFWYALMAVLPALYGRAGLVVSLRMLVAGLLGVAVYKLIKSRTNRPRPYLQDRAIVLGARPMDRYSFPSGHTLHAVMFTLLVCETFPEFGWLLLPFTALVTASRVALGLHYPTDVMLGALLGACLAWSVPLVL